MSDHHTYRMADHNTWGNRIAWWRIPDEHGRGRIHGWARRRPQSGDHIICPMQSGNNAIFEVQAEGNSYPYDPPDQFFVNVAFIGNAPEEGSMTANSVKRSEARIAGTPGCGCPTNEYGDIRCHVCGECVNVQCWKCGTKRGDGVCPSNAGGSAA